MFSTTPRTASLSFSRRVGRALRHALGGGLRRGDHQDLGARQVLPERQGDVPGPGRHVDQEDSRAHPSRHRRGTARAPCAAWGRARSRAARRGRRSPSTDSARRGPRRDEEVVDGDRPAPSRPASWAPRTRRHRRRAGPTSWPAGAEGDGQVDRHRRLPDPALARRDPDHPGARPGRHEAVGPARLVAERPRRPAGVVAVAGGPGAQGLDGLAPGPEGETAVELGALGRRHDRELDVHGRRRPATARNAAVDQVGEARGRGPAVHRDGQLDGACRAARHARSGACPARPGRGAASGSSTAATAARTSASFGATGVLSGQGPTARPGNSPRPAGRLVLCTLRLTVPGRTCAERRGARRPPVLGRGRGRHLSLRRPTRREIYLHVRSHPGATASEVASRVLGAPQRGPPSPRPAGGGRLPRGEPGALAHRRGGTAVQALPGRRRARRATPRSTSSTQRDDLLVALLAEALELLGPGRGRAHGGAARRGLRARAGRSYGARARVSARCAPPCTPSPTPSPPTASPPTPRTGASRPPWWPSTAPSARPPPNTR